MADIRKNSNLCEAVERDGKLCFKKRVQRNKYCSMHIGRLRWHKSFDLPHKEINKCKFIDCNEKSRANNYCQKHYKKYVQTPKNKMKECIAPDCETKRVSDKVYCGKHVKRLKIHGSLEGSGNKPFRFTREHGLKAPRRKKLYKECIVPQCNVLNGNNTEHIIKGLCYIHYQRWRKFGDYNITSKKEYEQSLSK